MIVKIGSVEKPATGWVVHSDGDIPPAATNGETEQLNEVAGGQISVWDLCRGIGSGSCLLQGGSCD